MERKTYNPYVQKVLKFDRFKGIVNPENDLTIPPAYVGMSSNVECFRVGEMTTRPGQVAEAITI